MGLARALEGLARNVGMHAGGVLIAPGKLTDFTPLYSAEGSGAMVSQFDKDDVEKAGLVKFDFLGLTTLTILDWAVRYVHRLGDTSFDLDAIPLDDKPTYQLLSKGAATAVFQLESRGMKDLLKKLKPDRFEDVIALVALYRPGPMDLIPDFIERKHGRQKVVYPDPRLEPILGPTYGIMVYQEQVMQIAQVLGGYSLGGATCCAARWARRSPRRWPSSARSSRRARRRTASRAQGRRDLRPDGEVRRLRLQQVARRGLRGARLPDRVHEGAPSRGLHGGEPLARHGRHRQGAGLLRRRARARPRDPAARRQRVRLPLRAARREAHPLRPGRGEGHRRAGDREHRRGARAAGPFRDLATSAAASTGAW
jgi:hypothetical protein